MQKIASFFNRAKTVNIKYLKILRKIFATSLLIIAYPAQAACLNPFGCTPSNYEECVIDATKRPTEIGVKMARQQCYEKWKLPEIEKNAASKAAAAEKRATNWFAMDKVAFNADAWIGQLGQPDMVIGPFPCSPLKDTKPIKGQSCYTYFWNDDRPGRYTATFKAEILSEAGKPLWAYWPDSLSR